MRRLVGLIAVVALASGCGGDDGDGQAQTFEETTTTIDETTTTRAEEESPSDLEDVVVQLGDLPSGWTVNEEDSDAEDDDSFCEDESTAEQPDPPEEAESSFKQSELGPFVSSGAGRYGSAEEAEEAFDFFVEEFAKCDGATDVDEDGTETTYSLSPLSFPDVGDDTYAARMSASTTFGPLEFDIVVERSDSTMLFIFNGGLGEIDTALTEELLRTMDARL
jgi:hypothetical protein